MLRALASVLLAASGGLLFVGAALELLGGVGAAMLELGCAALVGSILAAVVAGAPGPQVDPFDPRNVDRQDDPPRLRRPRDLSGRPVRR